MAAGEFVGPASGGEALSRERADGLEEIEAGRRAAAIDVDKRSTGEGAHDVDDAGLFEYTFDVGGDDRPGENGEGGEDAGFGVVEAGLRPGEDIVQAAVARRGVAAD